MINLAVINLKTVVKKTIKLFIVSIIILMIIKFISLLKTEKYISNFISKFAINNENIINDTLLISKSINANNVKKESGLKKILVSELAAFSTEEELMEAENQEEVIEFENSEIILEDTDNLEKENDVVDINTEIENVEKALPTKVIEKNNKKDTFTHTYGSVKIKNESQYELTTEMMTPNIDFTNKKDIIIYHTHTCESYTPTEQNNYQASGNFRTIDLNYSVARVGNELSNYLRHKNYNVMHNQAYHDYPAYSGSYTRSLKTIKEVLSGNSNTELVIDLHRDALGNNSAYGPTVQIGDEVAAQLMFVMGTDGGGLEHSNWLNNFKLAIKIQEKANEMYPGLFKPIILRNSRYNQHVASGACIIEVGATGNTLEQCNISMKYLAEVISEVMK